MEPTEITLKPHFSSGRALLPNKSAPNLKKQPSLCFPKLWGFGTADMGWWGTCLNAGKELNLSRRQPLLRNEDRSRCEDLMRY